jgi:hypothetical protein
MAEVYYYLRERFLLHARKRFITTREREGYYYMREMLEVYSDTKKQNTIKHQDPKKYDKTIYYQKILIYVSSLFCDFHVQML